MKFQFERDDFSVLIFQDSESRVKQVKLVLLIFSGALLSIYLNGFFSTENYRYHEILAGLVVFTFLYLFVTSDTTNIVAGMLLWSSTILTSYTAWTNDGLYDTAMAIFPCLLIFASLLGGKLLIFPLVIYMLVVFYFFAYAYSTGFADSKVVSKQSLWGKANDLAIVLCVYGAGIAIASSYAKRLIGHLFRQLKENESIQSEANKLILFDHLTQLPNEELCKQEIDEFIDNNPKKDGIIGFLTLDLDNFKWVNSSLGHSVGDEVLCRLSDRLKKTVDETKRLYHGTGNQFIFLLQASDYQEISGFAHQVLQIVYQPFQIKNYDIELSSSIGIAIAPFDGFSFETLRQKSHTAMSRAKEENETNTFKFFETEMVELVKRRLKIVQELKKAIERQEFELFYQPKVNLEDDSVEGAEALIRWKKGDSGFVSPAEFIPVAEESGLINEIGKWALEQACIDCKRWHELGKRNLSVAVNLSTVQFRRGNLPNIILRALKKAHLDPTYLELEITESLFIDNVDYIKEQIYSITREGVSIAIDDFGTGYSNLNYLTKFNASVLKIDMSFVRNMMVSNQQRHIVNAIIQMSNAIDLKNVAEGVEDKETVNQLKQFGCHYGQGYFWSKPLPNPEFIEQFNK